MTFLQKLNRVAVLMQALMWAILLILFWVVLPSQGFTRLEDFNDPAKVAAAPLAMAFIVWSDVAFGVTTLVSVLVLFQHMRRQMPLVVCGAVAIVLVGAV